MSRQRGQKEIGTRPELQKTSSHLVSREIEINDFTNIEIGCAFKVDIIRSNDYRVCITSSEAIFNYVSVTKSGKTLKITVKPYPFRTRPILQAQIAAPTFNKLRLEASKCTLKGFASEEPFTLNLCGASTLDIDMECGKTLIEVSGASCIRGNMKMADAELTISGASKVQLNGSAGNAILNAWGASKLDLSGFDVQNATISLNGASRAKARVNGSLNLDLSGASSVTYLGQPKLCDTSISGASTVCQK